MAHLRSADGAIDLIIPGPAATVLTGPLTAAQIATYATGLTAKPTSLRQPFIDYANSVLANVQKLQARMRSQQLSYNTAFTVADGWQVLSTRIRVIGEVWGYGEFNVQRTGDPLYVDPDGNFVPRTLGTIDTALRAKSLARLVSASSGRMAVGHTDSTGKVFLDALAVKGNIQTNEFITLAGMWPLNALVDSQS